MKNDLLEHIEDVHRELADARADADRLAAALKQLADYLETEIFISDAALLDIARAALDAHNNR